MSRLSQFLSLTVIVVFLLACNFVTGPIQDAQDLAQTAQSVATLIPVETLSTLHDEPEIRTVRIAATPEEAGDLTNPPVPDCEPAGP